MKFHIFFAIRQCRITLRRDKGAVGLGKAARILIVADVVNGQESVNGQEMKSGAVHAIHQKAQELPALQLLRGAEAPLKEQP